MELHEDLLKSLLETKDDSILIDLKSLGDILFIKLTGYIDTYNSNYFTNRMNKILEIGVYKIIFDYSGVSYVSSTGIGSFMTVLKTVKSHGGGIVLLKMVPRVYEVFSLLGFSQFFKIVDTLEDAITFLNAETKSDFAEVYENQCPTCKKRLIIRKPGRFRCPGCKSIITVNSSKQVFLG